VCLRAPNACRGCRSMLSAQPRIIYLMASSRRPSSLFIRSTLLTTLTPSTMLHALHLAARGLVACLSAVCLISAHAANFSIGEFDIPAGSFDRFALATSIITLLAAIPL
jgi:hypothetical protein